MLYPRNKEKELTKELFANPGSEYRGTPFWSWNCKVSRKLIREQLEVFEKMGFGGAHLHPRTGMDNEYLGEEFLELISYANEEAKKRGMLCWLYDEDRYPSGAAGGMVTENVDYRARHLLLTRDRKEDMCSSLQEFCRLVEKGEKPAGYYLTAYRIKLEQGCLSSYKRIEGDIPEDNLEDTVRDGRLWLAYVEIMRESPWFNDQTYVDVMNQKAIERFLEVTHQRYFEKVGKDFGKSIPAIFTDEPQIKGSMVLPDGDSEFDVTLSFTDDLPESFAGVYGTDLLEVLPELLWELPEGEASVHRYHYHDHLTERFVSAFSDTIADWCEKHNLAMTGHYMSEPTLYSQTLRLGEAMRCYRRQQIPGIDILCADPEYSTAKQAVSVARQYGRKAVLSELYGVTHWDHDFKGHKLQGDWQAALGVTVRCHHLAFMSMEGEAKRDWPASISYQSPWFEKYPYIENYFARLNTALTRGKADVRVGVLHPIESYWLSYGPVSQTQDMRDKLDQEYKELLEWLLFGTIDFDLISEGLLPEISVPENRPVFKVGEMEYTTILVPDMRTIRSTTLDRLEAFRNAGGNIIFAGAAPSLADAVRSPRPMELAGRSSIIPYHRMDILKALENDRTLEIRYENGRLSDQLFYQMRQDGNDKWLFVCHVNRQTNKTDQPENMILKVKGTFTVTCYNALNGETAEADPRWDNGWTILDQVMYPEDSLLWRLTPITSVTSQSSATEMLQSCTAHENQSCTADTSESGTAHGHQSRTADGLHCKAQDCIANRGSSQEDSMLISGSLKKRVPVYGLVAGRAGNPAPQKQLWKTIYEPDTFALEEPNALCLDKAAWRLDDGPLMPESEILRLDNMIRGRLGYPRRQDAFTQPWRIREAPENNKVTLIYTIHSELNLANIFLAMERPHKARITLNGTGIDTGEDCCQGYYVDQFIPVLPAGSLKAGDNQLILEIPFGRKSNLENIYLLGDFGVEIRGTKACIVSPVQKLFFGDITRQKLPFYGGNITYGISLDVGEDKQLTIKVPRFSSPVLEILLDGESRGLIAFAPHTLDLGLVEKGAHKLEIQAFGNRFNGFGTLHNCNDQYKWYGPDSYRTTGSEWSEEWCVRPFGVMNVVEIWE